MTSTNTNSGAVLIAEIGSVTTRVILADVVEGETRLIFQVETPSTIEPPYRNATIGVLQAASQIAELTGRNLLHEGQLIIPQTPERDGVNHIVATTSAAGNLAIIITAVASDVSARSALHASHSTYTSVLQVITLDDAVIDPTGKSTTSWIERQIEGMLTLAPDVTFIAGGLDGGPQESLCRLAQMVAFTAMQASQSSFKETAVIADDSETGESPPQTQAQVAIYAGNSEARAAVRDILAGRVKAILVDNVRPTLDQERLEEARQALNRLYDERILPTLPGLPALQQLISKPITTTCKSEGLMTRFLAERYQRQVLTLNIGATSSSAFLASPGSYHLAVLGLCGMGYGLTPLLQNDGPARIAQWLPFAMSEAEITHWLLNKLLRPQLVPASREDMLIEHAIAREILALLIQALRDECPDMGYDMVIAGGSTLAHVPPGLAALTILDILQPAGAVGVEHAAPLAVDLHLDSLGLLPACGALSALNADAAVTLFERDMLQNTPLGTCVVALGSGRRGKVALEAELTQTGMNKGVINRGTQRIQVRHGEIVHIPLDQGARAQLTLRPAGGVRIGRNAAGAEVQSEVSAISGSALGIIIDARGRPLQLPEHDAERQSLLWDWLAAMDVVQGQRPAIDVSTSVPGVQVPRQQPVPDERIAATTAAATAAAAAAATTSAQPRSEPASVAAPDQAIQPNQVAPGKRVSLADMVAEQAVASSGVATAESGKVAAGKRVSLADMVAEQPAVSSEVATAESGKVAAGKRVSLADMVAEESASANANASPPLSDTDSGSLGSDLSNLRQTVESKPKRRWFGRKNK